VSIGSIGFIRRTLGPRARREQRQQCLRGQLAGRVARQLSTNTMRRGMNAAIDPFAQSRDQCA
jgi:hypothetical protein